MVFIDSNIPMYLIGSDHPNQPRARSAIDRLVGSGARLVTDAEVLQEILHRYRAIEHVERIQPALDALYSLVDEVLPVTERDVHRAKTILMAYVHLSARDALHAAIMQSRHICQIVTFDRDFDLLPGFERLPA